MTFPIPPVAPVSLGPVTPSQASTAVGSPIEAQPIDNGGFADAINGALNDLSRMEATVTKAGQQAATGDLNSVGDYMIATAEAQLATEITVAIRDRAIAAFNDIMRMQI